MNKIRVGIVDFLNSKPLAWGFLAGDFSDCVDASYDPPARVADRLAAGEIDVGLIPAIEVQRIPDLQIIPGICVGSLHEVRSVLLLSRGPIHQVRRVALDHHSRNSAALVQILLRDRWGITPEVMPAAPDAEAMLRLADAALIIGDPALRVDRSRYQILDLAAEWRALTGLPAVFAVWAVRGELATRSPSRLPALLPMFEQSLARGLDELEIIASTASRELALPLADVRAYLSNYLSYRLGELELQSLGELWRRAFALGLLDRPPAPPKMWSDAEARPPQSPRLATPEQRSGRRASVG